MKMRKIGVWTILVTSAAASVPLSVFAADNNQDYRRKVIAVSGIMQNVSTDMEGYVTRAQFAEMLVNASSLRDYLTGTETVSVYEDVLQDHEFASSIRIAAEQGWMTGYLGGVFKPDQLVTMQEAARAVMALLGYTAEDFGGNISQARLAKFYALELNDEVDVLPQDPMTRNDCVNLFYNLLKTEKKEGGGVYGTVLGLELTADGEVDPMGLADTSLKGPKVVPKNRQLGDFIPFSVKEASIFINGYASSYESIKNELSNNPVVIYYNTKAKTVWAYVVDEDVQTGRCVMEGTVETIYYSSADVMTPTAIVLSEDGREYKLSSSQMQFAFSIYGSLEVGDKVTLICEKTVDAEENETYTVVDYVED